MEADKARVEAKVLCPLRAVGRSLKEALDEVSKRYCVEGWCAWWLARRESCAVHALGEIGLRLSDIEINLDSFLAKAARGR